VAPTCGSQPTRPTSSELEREVRPANFNFKRLVSTRSTGNDSLACDDATYTCQWPALEQCGALWDRFGTV
jgi:hypothetical protein